MDEELNTAQVEQWKPVTMFNCKHSDERYKYEVSSLGRVRSSWYFDRQGDWHKIVLLRQHIGPDKTLYVLLEDQRGIKYKYFVHHLVASAFIKNPNNFTHVRHLNGKRDNNAVTNLAWGSEAEMAAKSAEDIKCMAENKQPDALSATAKSSHSVITVATLHKMQEENRAELSSSMLDSKAVETKPDSFGHSVEKPVKLPVAKPAESTIDSVKKPVEQTVSTVKKSTASSVKKPIEPVVNAVKKPVDPTVSDVKSPVMSGNGVYQCELGVETWAPIVTCDSMLPDGRHRYEVSNFGRVRCLECTGARGIRRDDWILKEYVDGHGFHSVGLKYSDGKTKRCFVHKLVATAFIPNPDGATRVEHRDKDLSNNHYDNLRWVQSRCSPVQANGVSTNKKTGVKTTRYRQAVRQYTLDGKFIAEHRTAREAAIAIGLSSGAQICMCCNRRPGYTTGKGYIWRYSDDDEFAK